ncbi:MAG: hypothetical protein HQL75_18390 [Magnetococcales bacterium]|nr:hypothetical protein [Magnetococcales bacterium]
MKFKITMPAFVEKIRVGFDEKNPKQRYFILAIALIVSLNAWLTFLWDPHKLSMQASIVTTQTLHEEIDKLRKEAQLVASKKIEDPNALRAKRIEDLVQERQKLSDQLGEETGALIQPTEMVRALKQLLATRPNLQLVRMTASHFEPIQLDSDDFKSAKDGTGNAEKSKEIVKNEGPATKPDPKEKKDSETNPSMTQDAPVIFRHDIELEIQASFLEMLDFFKEIESYPWVFYWDTLHFQGRDYPNTHATLKLFTLSIGKGLVGG